jgi:hypothetical protein
MPLSDLPAYQRRVVEEAEALEEKAKKLQEFMGTATYGNLSDKERVLLRTQYRVMALYGSILQERIGGFLGG